LLDSFKICFESLKEETGSIAIHLKKTHAYPQNIRLKDRVGRLYTFSVDDTPFVLQEKKPILMQAVKLAMKEGKKQEAKQILAAFVELIRTRAKKGILFKDASYMRNYGYDGNKAYMIDIGSFYYREDLPFYEAYRKAFFETLSPLKDWLAEQDPELMHEFEEMAIQ
jgi:hypothetical protein